MPPAESWALLDNLERQRAAGFHFDSDRRLYVSAHASLRKILGRVSGVSPREIQLHQPRGIKPIHIAGVGRRLHFSLSHTSGCIAIAVSRAVEVGVDIERIRPAANIDQLSASTLHEEEMFRFNHLSADDKVTYFFRVWALKEAYAKALGVGLALSFPTISTGFRNVRDPNVRMWMHLHDSSSAYLYSGHHSVCSGGVDEAYAVGFAVLHSQPILDVRKVSEVDL